MRKKSKITVEITESPAFQARLLAHHTKLLTTAGFVAEEEGGNIFVIPPPHKYPFSTAYVEIGRTMDDPEYTLHAGSPGLIGLSYPLRGELNFQADTVALPYSEAEIEEMKTAYKRIMEDIEAWLEPFQKAMNDREFSYDDEYGEYHQREFAEGELYINFKFDSGTGKPVFYLVINEAVQAQLPEDLTRKYPLLATIGNMQFESEEILELLNVYDAIKPTALEVVAKSE